MLEDFGLNIDLLLILNLTSKNPLYFDSKKTVKMVFEES